MSNPWLYIIGACIVAASFLLAWWNVEVTEPRAHWMELPPRE